MSGDGCWLTEERLNQALDKMRQYGWHTNRQSFDGLHEEDTYEATRGPAAYHPDMRILMIRGQGKSQRCIENELEAFLFMPVVPLKILTMFNRFKKLWNECPWYQKNGPGKFEEGWFWGIDSRPVPMRQEPSIFMMIQFLDSLFVTKEWPNPFRYRPEALLIWTNNAVPEDELVEYLTMLRRLTPLSINPTGVQRPTNTDGQAAASWQYL